MNLRSLTRTEYLTLIKDSLRRITTMRDYNIVWTQKPIDANEKVLLHPSSHLLLRRLSYFCRHCGEDFCLGRIPLSNDHVEWFLAFSAQDIDACIKQTGDLIADIEKSFESQKQELTDEEMRAKLSVAPPLVSKKHLVQATML